VNGTGRSNRKQRAPRGHFPWRLAGIVVHALLLSGPALANDAEIVSLIGRGDSRETAQRDWTPASVKQKLVAGSFVRTREMSQMALLLRDRTQVRLNQLSILNIKAVNPGTPPPATQLDLPQGRAWSQAKPKAQESPTVGQRPARLEITMPGGTAFIRGTDWELDVDKDGTSTVTVMSGEVEFANDFGRVSVMPNEQARAVPGKPPVKILLSSAAERIQWVTAYRPQPRRWVKDGSGGLASAIDKIEDGDLPEAMAMLANLGKQSQTRVRAALLIADMHLYMGERSRAIEVLTPHADLGRGDPMAIAMLTRAQLIAGNFAEARRLLDQAAQIYASHIEIILARAEYSRLLGDEPGARSAYLAAIAAEPRNAEAWYGIGRIETEREYVKAAREALKRALALQPDGAGFQGELGTLETFANEFAAAEQAFRATLDKQPDDYVSLTGLGVLLLKRGDTEAALESFLKAGAIEPRYARAWLFSGAAYYQLGETDRAVEALRKASQLDDKDPLPHLMESLVHFDALALGRAIEAAREAQTRMPNVKSLNQVLTDQKGSANVGAALAAFGLEEWSQAYAYNAYNPYWAGSHLFLADRFEGTFNKNSALFKGFLSDPAVFGASNRFSSLVPVPGHYGSAALAMNQDYITDTGVSASVNGYSITSTPFSYAISGDLTEGDSPINRTNANGRMRARGENLTIGLGLRRSHELGIFAFMNRTHFAGNIADQASGLTDDKFSIDYKRADIGFSYKFSPTSHAWFKIGAGDEEMPVSGRFVSQATANALNTALGVGIFTAGGRLIAFRTDQAQRDIQFRHTFDASPALQLSWGTEVAKSGKPFAMSLEFLPLRIHLDQNNRTLSDNAYVAGRYRVSDAIEVELDAHYQDTRSSFSTDQRIEVVGGAILAAPRQSGASRWREINPRIGLKWRPGEAQTVRIAAQVWRKPAAVNTLGPVDTVGIPLDDRIERDGGKLKRLRLQHEIEWGTQAFFHWYADWKEIANPVLAGAGIVPDLQLDQLEKLRNRRRVFTLRPEYLEETPKFTAGWVKSAGMAYNRLMSRELTTAVRYTYAATNNTTPAFIGRDVPFHPRHYLNLALNWQPAPRWVIGPVATWRSSRFIDEANATRLSAGWSAGLGAYWESMDKRWSVSGVIDQIHADNKTSLYRQPTGVLQATYRF
jgi:tetratricopeptide (TPR) repeat protein